MVMILAFVVMALAVALVITLAMLSTRSPSGYSEFLKEPKPMWSVPVPSEENKYKELSDAVEDAKNAIIKNKLQIPPEKDE